MKPITLTGNQVSFIRHLIAKDTNHLAWKDEESESFYWEQTTDEVHRHQMRTEIAELLAEKSDGTCKDCHASLNNTDPDDHKCPSERDYDAERKDFAGHDALNNGTANRVSPFGMR